MKNYSVEKLLPKNNISIIVGISAFIVFASSIIRYKLFNSSGDLIK
jgi:hypothetical protein